MVRSTLTFIEIAARLDQRPQQRLSPSAAANASWISFFDASSARSVEPGHHLVGADAVAERVEHVADQDRLEERDEERRVHLEALLLAGRLLEAALLLEQQHAEAVEAGVAQRLAVLGDVHAEAARAAGAGGQEDVVLDDLLGRDLLIVAQPGQVLDQVADGEVGRVALAAVAELLAEGQRGVVRARRAPGPCSRCRASAPCRNRSCAIVRPTMSSVVCARWPPVNVVGLSSRQCSLPASRPSAASARPRTSSARRRRRCRRLPHRGSEASFAHCGSRPGWSACCRQFPLWLPPV